MSEKAVRYTKVEIGKVRVVDDFLPPPDELVPADDKAKAAPPGRHSGESRNPRPIDPLRHRK